MRGRGRGTRSRNGFEESMMLECVLFVCWVDTEVSVGVILAAGFGRVGAVVSDSFVESWSVVFLKVGPTVAPHVARAGALVEITGRTEGVAEMEVVFSGM